MEFGLGFSRGSQGRTIWIFDSHRGNGKRYVVRADEKLTVFLELDRQLPKQNCPVGINARSL
jgi:hypothetical protein